MIIVSHTAPTTGFEKGLSKGKKELGPIIRKRRQKGRSIDQFACQWTFSLLDLAGVGRSLYKCQASSEKRGK
jgi:hypothetical protein